MALVSDKESEGHHVRVFLIKQGATDCEHTFDQAGSLLNLLFFRGPEIQNAHDKKQKYLGKCFSAPFGAYNSLTKDHY